MASPLAFTSIFSLPACVVYVIKFLWLSTTSSMLHEIRLEVAVSLLPLSVPVSVIIHIFPLKREVSVNMASVTVDLVMY